MKKPVAVRRRITAFIVFVIFVFSLFTADLFRIQIVQAENYGTEKVALTSTTTTVNAARGEILDCNGIPIVTNRQVNSVVFYAPYFPTTKEQDKRNEIIIALIRLFEEAGVEWNDKLPLVFDENGNIQYKEDSKADIKFLKSKEVLFLNSYATAENCMDGLIEKFELQDYAVEDARKIASVCYSLKKIAFSSKNPFLFAEDIPTELAAKIKENSNFYKGVDILVSTERAYPDGTIAPHIIGAIGKLNEKEYKKKKALYEEQSKNENLTEEEKDLLKLRAYGMDDEIGKFGIESAMEDYLRGTNGIMTTTTDTTGEKTSEITRKPQDGDAVILTIDSKFQKQVQDALAAFIDSHHEKDSIPAVGSVVVMDVHDGSVLACATYPSYNLSSYYEDFSALSKDKSAPLWNRALQSTYAPGSTIKPAIAVAGLEEGVITEDTMINCTGIYKRFLPQMRFSCLRHKHSGNISVKTAIYRSCNIFFYETGFQLGIHRMNDYCTRFGLGQKTGVEVGESAGVLASKEFREAHGGIWYPGDTVQSAIGQSDHLFTPIQLCNYVATLANGGTRYQAHFVKSVKTSDYANTVLENKGTVLNTIGVSQNSLRIAKEGMRMLGADLMAFKDLPVNVAAKTGTAESQAKVGGKIEKGLNAFMITFAPYENPEIAVCVAIENLGSGAQTAVLAAEVYKAYFNRDSQISTEPGYNTLLG